MGSHKPGLSLPFDYKRRNKVVFSPMKTETHKKAIPKPVECLPDFGHFIPSSVSTRFKCQFLTEVSSGFLIQFHIASNLVKDPSCSFRMGSWRDLRLKSLLSGEIDCLSCI